MMTRDEVNKLYRETVRKQNEKFFRKHKQFINHVEKNIRKMALDGYNVDRFIYEFRFGKEFKFKEKAVDIDFIINYFDKHGYYATCLNYTLKISWHDSTIEEESRIYKDNSLDIDELF